MKKSNRVFGIDLGTTYSAIACVDEFGRPEVVRNKEGKLSTPSVVWFDEDKVVVGDAAKDEARYSPLNVCSLIKRNMGNDAYRMRFGNDQHEYLPEEISSFILRKVVQDASERLGEEIRDVVITCPAYFFVKERDATRRAGKIAGLNVLQIVDEPTAAAIAYGFSDADREKIVLAYDLGGGTFDVAAIRVAPDKIKVVCADGDHQLGGQDWDARLVSLIAERFQNETGSATNPLDSLEANAEFLSGAEKIKIELTEKEKGSGRFTFEGETVRIEITREEFEVATSDLLERTIEFAKSVAKKAKAELGGRDFDDLILVGGSSHMPAVARRLREAFRRDPILFKPEEAVARGAAIVGNNLRLRDAVLKTINEGRATELTLDEAYAEVAEETGYTLETVKRFTKQDLAGGVTSRCFGVDTLWGDPDDSQAEIRTTVLIHMGETRPYSITEHFYTVCDDQQCVNVCLRASLVEREEAKNGVPCDKGEILYENELPLPRKLPAGAPIDVTFNMSSDGVLSADIVEPTSGRSLHTEINTLQIHDEEGERRQIKRCSELVVE